MVFIWYHKSLVFKFDVWCYKGFEFKLVGEQLKVLMCFLLGLTLGYLQANNFVVKLVVVFQKGNFEKEPKKTFLKSCNYFSKFRNLIKVETFFLIKLKSSMNRNLIFYFENILYSTTKGNWKCMELIFFTCACVLATKERMHFFG